MTRIRSQSTPQSAGMAIAYDRYGAVLYTDTATKPPLESRVTADVVIPGFRTRSAKGEVFNNPYSSTLTNFQSNDVYEGSNTFTEGATTLSDRTSFTNGYWLTSLWNSGSLPFPTVPFDTNAAAATAAIDCLASVNKTEVDSMTFAAEWSKTKSLHRQLGSSLVRLFEGSVHVPARPLRKRKAMLYDMKGNPILGRNGKPRYTWSTAERDSGYSKGDSRLKSMSDLWLAVRFGVLPLLNDLEGACKVLGKSKALRQTARSSQFLQSQESTVFPFEVAYGQVANITLTTTSTWSLRYGILYETTAFMRAAAQMGLTRPLSTAWELVPWSFMVDWFVNVGSWLDAIQPSGAHNTLAAWASVRQSTTKTAYVSASLRANPSSSWSWSANWSGSLLHHQVVTTRDPWSATVPTSPSLGSGFNEIRSYDFAALIMQRIDRILNRRK